MHACVHACTCILKCLSSDRFSYRTEEIKGHLHDGYVHVAGYFLSAGVSPPPPFSISHTHTHTHSLSVHVEHSIQFQRYNYIYERNKKYNRGKMTKVRQNSSLTFSFSLFFGSLPLSHDSERDRKHLHHFLLLFLLHNCNSFFITFTSICIISQ